MRVVLDTSVLIAAFYPALDRPCFSRDVFDFVTRNAEGVISDDIHDEPERVLGREGQPVVVRREKANVEAGFRRRIMKS